MGSALSRFALQALQDLEVGPCQCGAYNPGVVAKLLAEKLVTLEWGKNHRNRTVQNMRITEAGRVRRKQGF